MRKMPWTSVDKWALEKWIITKTKYIPILVYVLLKQALTGKKYNMKKKEIQYEF